MTLTTQVGRPQVSHFLEADARPSVLLEGFVLAPQAARSRRRQLRGDRARPAPRWVQGPGNRLDRQVGAGGENGSSLLVLVVTRGRRVGGEGREKHAAALSQRGVARWAARSRGQVHARGICLLFDGCRIGGSGNTQQGGVGGVCNKYHVRDRMESRSSCRCAGLRQEEGVPRAGWKPRSGQLGEDAERERTGESKVLAEHNRMTGAGAEGQWTIGARIAAVICLLDAAKRTTHGPDGEPRALNGHKPPACARSSCRVNGQRHSQGPLCRLPAPYFLA